MKHAKLFKYISNISFGIGLAIGIYALIRIYFAGADLPPGVCPIDNSRPLIYVAIAMLIVSLIFSFFKQ